MSTGYFLHTGGGRLPLFLLFSCAIHLSLVLFVILLPSDGRLGSLDPANLKDVLSDRRERHIPVDIITLPPTPQGEAIPPDKVERYAQRSQRVERETVPEAGVAVLTPPVVVSPGDVRSGQKESDVAEPNDSAAGGEKSGENGTVMEKGAAQEKERGNPLAPAGEGGRPLHLYPTGDRLAALSEDYEKTAPKAEKGKKLALNTSEHRYWYYMAGVKRKIELQWDYPGIAIRKGQQGKLFITFAINRDGTVKSLKLVRGSGYPTLDNAALNAIRLAASFHPFPEEFEIEDLTIEANFEYVLHSLKGRGN